MRVAIVGGGVSGLSAAYRVRQELGERAEVLLFEQSSRLGGKLCTVDLAGCGFDLGAEAFLARRPEILDLATELGIRDEVVHPSGASAVIRAGGAARAIPRNTVLGVPTSAASVEDVLSAAGVAAVRAEALLPPLRWDGSDISVGTLLRERVGDEVVDRLVDPLLGGVYAGGADALGVRATMPALAAALDAGAETVTEAAMVASMPADTERAAPGPVFGAFRAGYQRLLERLRQEAGPREFRDHTVRELSRDGAQWRLKAGSAADSDEFEVDAVVLAVPAPAARRLVGTVAPGAADRLAEVPLASMIVVGMALPAGTALPKNSGVLIASGERHADGTPFTAKAFTLSGNKWPHLRGAADEVLLRASVGRSAAGPELQLSDDQVVRRVRADLAELTGTDIAPVESTVLRWGGGLPQYGVGHGELVAAVRAELNRLPGLELAGAMLDGVGVPACAGTGQAAARAIAAELNTST